MSRSRFPHLIVQRCVEAFLPAGTLADANAGSALGMRQRIRSKSPPTGGANSRAVANTRHVRIAVLESVTSRSPVRHASPPAMFIVATPSAPTSAVSPASPVPRHDVHRRALTVHVRCPVRLLVTTFLVPSAARNFWLVATNVPPFVARYAPHLRSVRYVLPRRSKTVLLTLSSVRPIMR